nr:fumarylacetoacetate hydrolase family protein [Nocardioides perillae]
MPWGVVVPRDARTDEGARVAVRIGDHVLDVAALAGRERPDLAAAVQGQTLDALLAAGPRTWAALRGWLTDALTREAARPVVEPHLRPLAEVGAHLPFTVADYVDFYASEHHASHVGRLFRPGQPPLPPQWRRLPVGYHGRAGTVVVSGTPVVRPCGLRVLPGDDAPTFGPTRRLDLEAEVAFVVGVPSEPGARVPAAALAEHVLGVVLLDDWSARDVQAYEYVPLGPFLGKSFATSVAAWVTPLAALEAARCPLPGQDPPPAPHLAVDEPAGYDLALEVAVGGTVVSRPPYAATYWSPGQLLAHLTSGGAPLRTGDLLASGTVSGPGADERGSLLELTDGWRVPVATGRGERLALEDGDEVVLRATAAGALGGRVQLGEVAGTVLPARP